MENPDPAQENLELESIPNTPSRNRTLSVELGMPGKAHK
jgi:hypothetical protein